MKKRLFDNYFGSEHFKFFVLFVSFLVAYFCTGYLGLELATINESVSPVWPATGLAMAILTVFGRKYWFSISIGAFLVNYVSSHDVGLSIVISLGNTLEAVAGAELINFVHTRLRRYFGHQIDTISYISASVLGSAFSSCVGVGALYFFDKLPIDKIEPVWITWWIGDALGALVFTPFLVSIFSFKLNFKRWPDAIGLVSLVVLISYFVFAIPQGSSFLFLLFPVLLFAARGFDRIGVFFASLFICSISIAFTISGQGPFSLGSLNERLVHLQLFLSAIGITGLWLAGIGARSLQLLPSLVLLFCWMLSGVIFYSFDQTEKTRTQAHFRDLSQRTIDRIREVIDSYEDGLRSGVGLFSASEEVELREWRSFIRTLEVKERHPGMNGMGVIWLTQKSELDNLVKKMKKQGLPDFAVKPVPGYESEFKNSLDHFIIKIIEPLELNLASCGLDIGSEGSRRRAAEVSRDTGKATITSKIVLVQDQKKTPGFLFLLPIYKNNSEVHTIAARKKNILGWVYGPFIYSKVFNEVLNTSGLNEIEVQAYEKDDSNLDHLVFSNYSQAIEDPDYELMQKISIGQVEFFLKWRKSPSFISSHITVVAWVGLCGAIASILFANLVLSVQIIGRRSWELAQELTQELSNSRERFKEGERRLLYALDGSNDGIWDWNLIKGEMYVSEKMAQFHGWPQTFRFSSIDHLKLYIHPEDAERTWTSLKKLMKKDSSVHEIESRYRTKSGDWRWILSRGKISEFDENGNPTRITGVHIDIDELKKVQSLQLETQVKLQAITDSVPTNVSLWTKFLTCEFMNELFGEWLGLSVEQAQDKPMSQLFLKAEFEFHLSAIERALEGETIQIERECSRPADGEVRYAVITYRPYNVVNEIKGFFLFIQDITDLKQAELSAKEERQTAIEATNIKSQFLANMSHEIRTPLNGIIGMAALLNRTELTGRQKEYSTVIARSSDALLNIVNDILDFSKAEAGKLMLETVDFNLNSLVDDVVNSLSYSANEKGLVLESKVNVGGNAFLKGDPSRIRQIVLNLVSNAIKFTPSGSVCIEVKENRKPEESEIEFRIKDTGIGIPQEALGKMFQAFSQVDSSMSRKYGGSGLGLSICKELVKLMDGTIGVESKLGEGSVFWFKISLQHGHEDEQSVEYAGMPSEITKDARILIVEDNRVNQQIAVETLKSIGYNPHAVGNGLEALEILKDAKYDLILMDCQMPELDGFQTTKVIRTSDSLGIKSIPIVAMTANALSGDREKCLECGMNDYLSKPIEDFKMVSIIEKWLHKSSKIISSESAIEGERVQILIVEDNEVNIEVISLNLEHLSYTYKVAKNGLEALDIISRNRFDLILMDCQIPELDGFETTKRIRELGSSSKLSWAKTVPIVALTANALKGDRERCLEAGMSDYLSKPVKMSGLEAMLKRWLDTEDGRAIEQVQNEVIDTSAIDRLRSLQKPGRPNLLNNLISLFVDSSSREMSQLHSAVDSNDLNAIHSVAHSLKSSAANLGATELSLICQQFEGLNNEKESVEAELRELLARAEVAYAKSIAALKDIRDAA